MGHGGSKAKLKKVEIEKLADETHFDADEIQTLYEHFRSISSSKDDDAVIDIEEFKAALGLKTSLFVERCFALFDHDRDKSIDFREFLLGLSVFSEKGTLDEKLRFSFRIYDVDGDGIITKPELIRLLEACLAENGLSLPSEQLKSLVDKTFEEADVDGDGGISFNEYRALVSKHPSMISNMTITTPVDNNRFSTASN